MITVIIIGLICIGAGFLVRKYPNALAGYNTLSKEQKSKIDRDKVTAICRNGLVSIGISMPLIYFLLNSLGWQTLAAFSVFFIPVIGALIICLLLVRHGASSKKKTIAVSSVFIVIMALVGWSIIYSMRNTEVVLSGNTVVFTGLYGTEIEGSFIDNVSVSDTMDNISYRSNGFSFGGTNKGYFQTKNLGNVLLYIDAGKEGPFITVHQSDGKLVIYRTEDWEEAMQVMNAINTIRFGR